MSGPEPSAACDVRSPRPGILDVVLGIGLPVLCLAFDPIVFRNQFMGGTGFLQSFAMGAYTFIGLAIACLASWIAFRRPSVLLGGALAAASAVSLLLGIALLPLSIPGAFFLIGVLGFSPFAVAYAYGRNAAAVLRAARASGAPRRYLTAIAGATLIIGLPLAGQVMAWHLRSRAIEDARSTDLVRFNRAIPRLKLLEKVVDIDPLVDAYAAEEDPARKAWLASAYREVTGEEVEERLAILRD